MPDHLWESFDCWIRGHYDSSWQGAHHVVTQDGAHLKKGKYTGPAQCTGTGTGTCIGTGTGTGTVSPSCHT